MGDGCNDGAWDQWDELAQAHRQAGRGALDAVDALNAFGDRVAQLVEVVGLHLDDDVVGAGNGIDGRDACVAVAQGEDSLADSLRPTYFRFNKDVAANWHSGWLLL